MIVLTTEERAAVQLGARRLDRPPWREVLGGWYPASPAVTFGGGAVLAIALFWLAPLAVATHVVTWFAQRRRLPAEGHHGVPA
ncbi:hypothetical protein ACIRSS_15165 [Amycolatopsis sp. NPDC101161]|uniref:hypothetical protein n=1 Tax=Amycolatopsis sp. NPDC101161 TaxID=3363940 RepID=UPI003815A899